MKDYGELKMLAEAATPGDWQVIETELPCRLGRPHIERRIFTAKDHPQLKAPYPVVNGSVALGTDETPVHHMVSIRAEDAAFIAAANPDSVLALIAEVEDLRKGRTDWQAECLKRGFEYVLESDDHYVLADIPEMAELLGLLLGVEVRSKDNDSYGETVSILQDMADANSDAFHRAYELEKENEYLKKDAARFKFIEQDASSGMSNIYGDEWVSVIDSIINEDNNK